MASAATPGCIPSYEFLRDTIRSRPIKHLVQVYTRTIIESGLAVVIMNGQDVVTRMT